MTAGNPSLTRARLQMRLQSEGDIFNHSIRGAVDSRPPQADNRGGQREGRTGSI